MPSAVAEAAEAVEGAEGVGAAAGAEVAAVASRGGLAASAERVIFSETRLAEAIHPPCYGNYLYEMNKGHRKVSLVSSNDRD
jgi:hypothetical protein